MNSVRVARAAWEKMRQYSVITPAHYKIAIKSVAPEDSPSFVIENATRRLREHHERFEKVSSKFHAGFKYLEAELKGLVEGPVEPASPHQRHPRSA